MASVWVAPNFFVLPPPLPPTIATCCLHCAVCRGETLLSKHNNSLSYPNRTVVWYSLILDDKGFRTLNCFILLLSFLNPKTLVAQQFRGLLATTVIKKTIRTMLLIIGNAVQFRSHSVCICCCQRPRAHHFPSHDPRAEAAEPI
jgi:hypothetical protein